MPFANHCISKTLVATAQRTGRGLAREDLTGIRARGRFKGGQQRASFHRWSFAQLGFFLDYKARRAGVKHTTVDPRHTSQTCPWCGHRERANRNTRDQFHCQNPLCRTAAAADYVAALNIGGKAGNRYPAYWASVNAPHVPDAGTVPVAPGTSPLPLGVGI